MDRGVTILQQQVRELSTDLAELKGETRAWQQGHNQTHESEQRDRVAGRRWLVGIGVAGLASAAAVIGLLVDVVYQVHH